ncbi:putative nuclease HARBI1 [Lucilia cuprina]|nr:putative nuclease HARBI1 [Lucilia cuprina]
MEKITILYAQKLIEDLMESSSSSDEDDEVFAVLNDLDKTNPKERTSDNKEMMETNEKIQTTANDVTVANVKEITNIKDKMQDDDRVAETNETLLVTAKTENYKEVKDAVVNSPSLAKDKDNVVKNVLKRLETEKSNLDKEVKAAFQEERFLSFEDKVMNMISERNFKHNFHVSRGTAIYLMEKYSLWYCKTTYLESSVKSRVETNVLAYLWFSANKTNFRSIAKLFKQTLSHIYKAIKTVVQFLVEELGAEVVKFPHNHPEKEAVAKEFEMVAGFPNVLGCFAESFFTIKVQKLAQDCGGYIVYLRGICDAKSKFLYAKTGIPRETVDTFLEKDLPELCSADYHLLGDVKCPIREYLMIPFDNDGKLDEAGKMFNIKLIRTHVKIKKAFGLLRSRFQQLKYLDFLTAETMSEFIFSCCVVHNICIDRDDSYNEEICTDVSDRLHASSLSSIKNDEFLSDLGLMKRFELKHIIFNNKT